MSQYFGEHGYKTLTAGKIYHASRVDKASFQVVGPRPGQRLSIDQQLVPTLFPVSCGTLARSCTKNASLVMQTATWAVEQIKRNMANLFSWPRDFIDPMSHSMPRSVFLTRTL